MARFLLLLCVCSCLTVFTSVSQADEAKKFHAILDEHWEWHLETNPTEASSLGDERYNHLWPDRSLKQLKKNQEYLKELLKRVQQVDEEQLEGEDRISYQLFVRKLNVETEGFQYGWHLVPLDQMWGIQNANELVNRLSFDDVEDYENWIARLNGFGEYTNQTMALMREGIRRGIVHPKVIMNRIPAQLRLQVVVDPTESPFYDPLESFSSRITEEERKRLKKEARKAIRQVVVPAYVRFTEFFESTYLPACFDDVGVSQIPNGQDFYAYRARLYTTTELTPREIHEIGLAEVKRIRGEMEQIIEELKFGGSFQEFLEFLRTDPRFYYEDPNELFAAVQAVCKKIDPQLVKLFEKLPRMPYGVKPIPAATAPNTTAAYYMQPAADGTRAGTYYFNLYKPEQRPIYTLEALSLHEAVPGHHLQIALAMELEGIPAFRRYGGYTAFIEGWGLYSESLGDELGLYNDPYSRFGKLTYEMWRAIRLVVDTGMHSLGWTRQEAIDLFVENTAKSRLDIENEVDRYIAWPGQALAYKIGELKIKELRDQAQQELGDEFDIREFHTVVLSHGAVTLSVLEAEVEKWIESKK